MSGIFSRMFVVAALFGIVAWGASEQRSRHSPEMHTTATPPPDPDAWANYAPEVREVMRTTYLGHAYNNPDPGEPVEVLKAFLRINRHKTEHSEAVDTDAPGVVQASYQVRGDAGGASRTQQSYANELDAAIADWLDYVNQYPDSRHAHLGLATVANEKADYFNDDNARRIAADHFIRAAELALDNGRVLYTHEVSRVLVAVKDPARLDAIFGRILQVAPQIGPKEYYLALVDYADGLARLRRPGADERFEEAIRVYEVNNIEAINRYAQHLLDRGAAARALAVLDQVDPDVRQMKVLPVFLRKQALQRLGRNTSSADVELARLRERLGENVQGGVPTAELSGQPFASPRPAQWAHSTSSDDCRSAANHNVLTCSTVPSGGWCWYPYTVNLGEVLWNEARGESYGGQAMVAWTVRDRVFQTVRCDVYIGGANYNTAQRDNQPCSLPDQQSCQLHRGYCWALHGATTSVGTTQWQFNDTHKHIDDLANSGVIYSAFYVVNGWMWEPSTPFFPPGVWNCTGDGCNGNICYSGSNYLSPSPSGPMEYRSSAYVPAAYSCKTQKGTVCANAAPNNYFWNRTP